MVEQAVSSELVSARIPREMEQGKYREFAVGAAWRRACLRFWGCALLSTAGKRLEQETFWRAKLKHEEPASAGQLLYRHAGSRPVL